MKALADGGTGSQPPQKEKRWYPHHFGDLVAGLTLIVLSVTMVFVIKYACEARRQTRLLNSSVKQQIENVKQQVMINRPVIIANGIGIVEKNSFGVPIKVRVATVNFGRSTASVMTAVGHIFTTNAGEPARVDDQCKEGGPWPKGNRLTALVPYQPPPSVTLSIPAGAKPGLITIPMQPIGATAWDWTPGEGFDPASVNKGKTLFVIGCIYYRGLDDRTHFSDVCASWAGGTDFPSCPDLTRNFVH